MTKANRTMLVISAVLGMGLIGSTSAALVQQLTASAGVVSDANGVTAWNDQSGNGYNATILSGSEGTVVDTGSGLAFHNNADSGARPGLTVLSNADMNSLLGSNYTMVLAFRSSDRTTNWDDLLTNQSTVNGSGKFVIRTAASNTGYPEGYGVVLSGGAWWNTPTIATPVDHVDPPPE